jgi:hypothetical protein
MVQELSHGLPSPVICVERREMYESNENKQHNEKCKTSNERLFLDIQTL